MLFCTLKGTDANKTLNFSIRRFNIDATHRTIPYTGNNTDAYCFILFERIGALSVLSKLYSEVITTPKITVDYWNRVPRGVDVKAVHNRELLYTYPDNIVIGEASAMVMFYNLDS